jgi:hypothetical protein
MIFKSIWAEHLGKNAVFAQNTANCAETVIGLALVFDKIAIFSSET